MTIPLSRYRHCYLLGQSDQLDQKDQNLEQKSEYCVDFFCG
jgi:hypothetical protein